MTADRLSELEHRLRAALAALAARLRLATDTPSWRRFEGLLHGGVHVEPPAAQKGVSSSSPDAPDDPDRGER